MNMITHKTGIFDAVKILLDAIAKGDLSSIALEDGQSPDDAKVFIDGVAFDVDRPKIIEHALLGVFDNILYGQLTPEKIAACREKLGSKLYLIDGKTHVGFWFPQDFEHPDHGDEFDMDEAYSHLDLIKSWFMEDVEWAKDMNVPEDRICMGPFVANEEMRAEYMTYLEAFALHRHYDDPAIETPVGLQLDLDLKIIPIPNPDTLDDEQPSGELYTFNRGAIADLFKFEANFSPEAKTSSGQLVVSLPVDFSGTGFDSWGHAAPN